MIVSCLRREVFQIALPERFEKCGHLKRYAPFTKRESSLNPPPQKKRVPKNRPNGRRQEKNLTPRLGGQTFPVLYEATICLYTILI